MLYLRKLVNKKKENAVLTEQLDYFQKMVQEVKSDDEQPL